MKLKEVEIKNFRSIKQINVSFEPACRVLVGINESGKSNILKALSFLGKNMPNKKSDIRQALPDEERTTESFVDFIFKFEKTESDNMFEIVSSKILSAIKNPEIVIHNGINMSVKEFCNFQNEGLYSVDVIKETKTFKYWEEDYQLTSGWKKPASICPVDFNIEIKGQNFLLSQYKLIRGVDVGEVPEGYLEDAKIADLVSMSGEIIVTLLKENLPDTLFWEYDEKNLLPSAIKIVGFCEKPDSCIPLMNMFALSGIKNNDIAKEILDAKEAGNNQFQNFLNGISKKATNHFRSVWKEYKEIEFSLRLNNDQIDCGVKEKNTLDFKERSDGFKRFITFLLMISVNVKTDNLVDTLLLVDEPEISLHPSGARYLRDELIKISKTNYVVYSTHSIFMIDSSEIGRHYIVKKNDETTTIESVEESNVADEEILYNALGHSVFSVLKEKNIIFEGWNDKHLFSIALQNASTSLKNKYKDISICHARGVASIKTITPMIELAKRKCLIISDGDKAAKEQQKKYKTDKGFGEWKIYQDIDSGIEAITGEDFISNDYITSQINLVLLNSSMPSFDQVNLTDKNKITSISAWLIENGMTAEQSKDKISEIKNSIFENLKPKNINSSYDKIFEGISF